MGKYNTPSDALRTIKDIGARLSRTERTPRAGNTSIDTGTFTLKNPNTGNTVFYVGLLSNGDYGVEIYRDDGTIAIRIGRAFISDPTQRILMYNRSGQALAGDQFLDYQGGINYGVVPAVPTTLYPQVGVTSAVFVDTHIFYVAPRGGVTTFYFSAICTDGTTSGEVILTTSAGVPLTAIFGSAVTPCAIPLGTIVETSFNSSQNSALPAIIPTRNGTPITIKAQARRTAGAGTINIRPQFLYESPT